MQIYQSIENINQVGNQIWTKRQKFVHQTRKKNLFKIMDEKRNQRDATSKKRSIESSYRTEVMDLLQQNCLNMDAVIRLKELVFRQNLIINKKKGDQLGIIIQEAFKIQSATDNCMKVLYEILFILYKNAEKYEYQEEQIGGIFFCPDFLQISIKLLENVQLEQNFIILIFHFLAVMVGVDKNKDYLLENHIFKILNQKTSKFQLFEGEIIYLVQNIINPQTCKKDLKLSNEVFQQLKILLIKSYPNLYFYPKCLPSSSKRPKNTFRRLNQLFNDLNKHLNYEQKHSTQLLEISQFFLGRLKQNSELMQNQFKYCYYINCIQILLSWLMQLPKSKKQPLKSMTYQVYYKVLQLFIKTQSDYYEIFCIQNDMNDQIQKNGFVSGISLSHVDEMKKKYVQKYGDIQNIVKDVASIYKSICKIYHQDKIKQTIIDGVFNLLSQKNKFQQTNPLIVALFSQYPENKLTTFQDCYIPLLIDWYELLSLKYDEEVDCKPKHNILKILCHKKYVGFLKQQDEQYQKLESIYRILLQKNSLDELTYFMFRKPQPSLADILQKQNTILNNSNGYEEDEDILNEIEAVQKIMVEVSKSMKKVKE